jgi:Tfp pilus assembly protein PilO
MNGYMIAKQAGQENIISVQQTMDELAKAYNIKQKDVSNEVEMKDKAQEMKDKLIALAQQQGMDTNAALQSQQPQNISTQPTNPQQ